QATAVAVGAGRVGGEGAGRDGKGGAAVGDADTAAVGGDVVREAAARDAQTRAVEDADGAAVGRGGVAGGGALCSRPRAAGGLEDAGAAGRRVGVDGHAIEGEVGAGAQDGAAIVDPGVAAAERQAGDAHIEVGDADVEEARQVVAVDGDDAGPGAADVHRVGDRDLAAGQGDGAGQPGGEDDVVGAGGGVGVEQRLAQAAG